MITKNVKLGLLGAFLSVAVVSGQGPIFRPIGPMAPAASLGSATDGVANGAQSLINGTAVDANAAPIPNVTVRLRNLQLNEIEQVSTSNSIGEFSFIARPETPYVIEIADQAGRVIAIGDIITAQAGDVAGTIVSLPTRLDMLAGVFNESAGSVVSAATGTGVTAVEAAIIPLLSPES